MNNKLKLVSPIPVSLNHYLGHRAVCKAKGDGFVSVYTTKAAKNYQEKFTKYAKEEVKKQHWDIKKTENKHYVMECIFYFDQKGKDDQNHYKILSDCLNGIAYIDDKNVIVRTKKVVYDNLNPRIEIEIYPVEYIGIFDNEEQLHNFESKCKTCNRYKRNCSILKKAKEGRIQPEINMENLVCSTYKEIKK
ncbi:RusA family crossover junction endodeoxyribonuclease [Halalkalibacter oceani]|uniref:RusA family crossover junction endodeoxyribonuclease n=1 Tax=Halalkalibacter oceani TaxID=1653776 RepID=UPI0033977444